MRWRDGTLAGLERRIRARWRRRTVLLVTGVFVGVLVVDFAVLAGMSALGLPLIPGAGAPPVSASAVPTPTGATVVGVVSPAVSVVRRVLDVTPSGWASRGDVSWGAGTMFGWACGPAAGPGAVAAGQRAFRTPSGPVAVTVSTYGAGLGAVAYDALSSQVGSCRAVDESVGRYTSTLGGVDAMIGWATPTGGGGSSTLVWRRGDVVASVTRSGDPSGLADAASQVDASLRAALVGVCADTGSVVDDAVRNPWADRSGYEGAWEPRTVTLPTPGEAGASVAAPSPGPSADVPDGWQPGPSPTVTASVPATPSLPRWPQELPSAVPTPKASPVDPGPAPTKERVRVAEADTVGPGCGWAFTGQVAPVFNEAENAQQVAVKEAQARERLVAAQQAWVADVTAYRAKWARWVRQVYLFGQYAGQLDAVASAWDAIQAQRDAYVAAVEVWREQVAARRDLLKRQAQARQELAAAEAACATYSPAPQVTPSPEWVTPSPTPVVSPGPVGSDGLPGPDVTVTPSPVPTLVTGAPTSTDPGMVCPPVTPSVLQETVPAVPPSPTPPPNPVPSASGVDTGALAEAGMPVPAASGPRGPESTVASSAAARARAR